ASAASAFLPARYGQTFADEAALRDAVLARAAALDAALELVRGCSQMTLRWLGTEPAEPAAQPVHAETAAGPGTRYLDARRRAIERRESLPELDATLAPLRPCTRAERLRRGGAPGLLGSIYHLVPDVELSAYRDALAQLAAPPHGRLRASGPWPSYAFAPEL